jgi:large subunit ribosomal protein L4
MTKVSPRPKLTCRIPFGREYNESLIHQVVVAFQANARQGTRAQKDREQVRHSTKKPFKQRYRSCTCWYDIVPAVAWRWSYLPRTCRTRTSPEDQQEDVPRWYGFDLLSAGARRPSGCREFPVRGFASTPVPDKFKAMNLNSVLVIADVVDENLYLASHNP